MTSRSRKDVYGSDPFTNEIDDTSDERVRQLFAQIREAIYTLELIFEARGRDAQ